MMELAITVVIPTFNRKDTVLRCLRSLESQTLSASRFEVVVVVDGSTDGTHEAIEHLGPAFALRLLFQANQGPAAARNLGARHARGRYLLFLDDDIVASPSVLDAHLAAHERHGGGVVVGPTPISPLSPQSAFTSEKEAIYRRHIARLERWGFDTVDPYHCLGANTSLERALFEKVGGYDESLHSEGDDLDLGLRLRSQNVPFYWVGKAVGWQLLVKTKETYLGMDRLRRARNEGILMARHPSYRAISVAADAFAGDPLRSGARRLVAAAPVEVTHLLRRVDPLVARLPFVLRRPLRRGELRATALAAFWEAMRLEAWSHVALTRSLAARLPVLLYHVVRDDLPAGDAVIGTHRFRRQMEALVREGYETITLERWWRWLMYDEALPEKPVVICFDDGFRDTHDTAWPILRDLGFSCTVFLVASRVGATNDWDGIVRGQLPLMTARQVVDLQEQGVSFGAHAVTHRSLGRLRTEEVHEEVRSSRSLLGQLLGTPPDVFAYPYGTFDPVARRAVAEAGFRMACTTLPGRNDLKTDPLRLRRVTISGLDSMLGFRLKVRYGHGTLRAADLGRSLRGWRAGRRH